jgi:hypothetical protein
MCAVPRPTVQVLLLACQSYEAKLHLLSSQKSDVGDQQSTLQNCQQFLRLSVSRKYLFHMQVMSVLKTNHLALWI